MSLKKQIEKIENDCRDDCMGLMKATTTTIILILW